LTEVLGVYRVTGTTASQNEKIEVNVSFPNGLKAIATDSHFLVPFVVLLAGIALLVVLH
jgi:hypothetical protein